MDRQNRRTDGRIVLAWGESTGHCHEVVTAETGLPPGMEVAQYFEVDGVRELVVLVPCVLRHDEHAPIALDPTRAYHLWEVLRQGDVCLAPTAPGIWRVLQQAEWVGPDRWRQVAD